MVIFLLIVDVVACELLPAIAILFMNTAQMSFCLPRAVSHAFFWRYSSPEEGFARGRQKGKEKGSGERPQNSQHKKYVEEMDALLGKRQERLTGATKRQTEAGSKIWEVSEDVENAHKRVEEALRQRKGSAGGR